MMYLVDTNIFLKIFLGQDKKDKCKAFLKENIGKFSISDFSLHSIGIILFKNDMNSYFTDFIRDIGGKVSILSLNPDKYEMLVEISQRYKLDFDDAYQCSIAGMNELTIVTMDMDFKNVTDIDVMFI